MLVEQWKSPGVRFFFVLPGYARMCKDGDKAISTPTSGGFLAKNEPFRRETRLIIDSIRNAEFHETDLKPAMCQNVLASGAHNRSAERSVTVA